MKFHARYLLLALVALIVVAASAPAAQAFGVEKFFAANCTTETCGLNGKGELEPPETPAEAEKEAFRQAGGWVPYGITDFKMKTVKVGSAFVPEGAEGAPGPGVRNLRTDVAAGVVTNPEAVTKCSMKDFAGEPQELAPGVHTFTAPKCPESSIVGVNRVITSVEVVPGVFADVPLEGLVYNLEQPEGLASDFGVAVDLAPLFKGFHTYSHTFIEGSVEWLSDYHDYFNIKNVTPGLIESRLVFFGTEAEPEVNGELYELENSGFLRNPSACTAPGPATTTSITTESWTGEKAPPAPYTDLVGSNECTSPTKEPFEPTFTMTPETKVSDAADGLTIQATMPHPTPVPGGIDSSDLKTATVTLPPGLTMNPSAGAGLEACKPSEIGLNPVSTEVTCPNRSRIGTVELEVPTLPGGQLKGPIYLGQPESGPITGPPYTIYLDAESKRYGVKVRLEGTVEPNPVTGQLTTTFANNPAAPFKEAILHFNGGKFAPIANPQPCGTGAGKVSFSPYATGPAVLSEPTFTTEGCGGFAPNQSLGGEPAQAGGSTTFTLNMERPEGQQFLSSTRTVLPPGLVGNIPAATQCSQSQIEATACPASSQVGNVTALSGSGPEPFPFHGTVYLAGPGGGSPYRLAVFVPIVAGPFNLGVEKTIVNLNVDKTTAQVIASATLPRIRGGVPARIRALSVAINRQGFERNPTNCSQLFAETTFTSVEGATSLAKTPFQAEGCSSLAFKPAFSAATSAKTSRANGASLETTLGQTSGQANIKSVLVTLPKQLPSRLSTLQKACLLTQFGANPFGCPEGSFVGTAEAKTPTLPEPLKGPAIFVARGGAEFPDFDLVLEGDNGIRVILKGTTHITKGITTTFFESTPDVPVTSVKVTLPTGPHSALGSYGNLCKSPLYMPTTITGQNGAQFKQKTKINVKSCGVQIVGRKVVGSSLYLTIRTFGAGKITGGGRGLSGQSKTYRSAQERASLKLRLRGNRHGQKIKVRVGFKSKTHGLGNSSATVTVKF
jgi:hypothetical protein